MSFSGIRPQASLRFHRPCFPTHLTLLALIHLPFFSSQNHALYVFNVDGGDSIDLKVVSVRPYLDSAPMSNHKSSCMQLTDRRIYFTWEDARRRDVPLYKDEADTRPEPSAMSTAEPSHEAWANPNFGGHSPSP